MNTAGISTVEFFWGLGLPLVLESTFLQLFLSKLGVTNFIIGFVPTILFVGQAFLGVVSAYQSRKLNRQRTIVILFHFFPAIAVLSFGLYLFFSGTFLPSTVNVFFIVYIIFNAGIGLIMPVWQNFIVKLFDAEKVIPAFAVMMISQSAGRLISSFYITGFFSDREITATTSSFLFILCGLLLFVGSFGFLITREPEIIRDEKNTQSGFFSFILKSFVRIIKNKNLVLFLLSDIDMYAVIAVISFYANYAVRFYGIAEAVAAGIFVGLNYAGQIMANIIFGTFNLFSIKGKCFAGRVCSISGIVLIISGASLPVFLLSSVLLGISRASRSLVYAPSVKIISGEEDATSYYAAAPIFMLPLGILIPLVCGKLLDSLPFEGPVSYKVVFLISGFISFLSIFFIGKVRFSPPSVSEAEA